MSTQLLTVIDSALSLIVAILLLILVFKNKKVAEKVEGGLEKAKTAADAAETILGPTPAGPVIHVVDEALKAADVGVKFAEQLYVSGNAVNRKEEAVKYVNTALDELGIKVTPQLSGIIDGAIEAAVFALPQTPAPKTAAAPEAPTPANK